MLHLDLTGVPRGLKFGLSSEISEFSPDKIPVRIPLDVLFRDVKVF